MIYNHRFRLLPLFRFFFCLVAILLLGAIFVGVFCFLLRQMFHGRIKVRFFIHHPVIWLGDRAANAVVIVAYHFFLFVRLTGS